MRTFLTYAIMAAAVLGTGGVFALHSSADVSAVPSGVRAIGVTRENAAQSLDRGPYAFYFTRGIYSSYGRGGFGRGGGGSWATDYPKADLQFLTVLRRLTNLDAYDSQHAVRLDDPELIRFPFLYILEVGGIALSPPEVANLRDYLLKGGFVFVDDFWGDNAWAQFQYQMQQVLPEHPIVEMSLDHEIFKVFYEIKALQQMPAIGAWRSGETTECWGCEIHVRGIFDDKGRLMMLINWNTDNGDAWEWAEQPDIPLKFSTFAYQIGVNAIVYAMSH